MTEPGANPPPGEPAGPRPEDPPGTIRHAPRAKPFAPPGGEMHLEEIEAHVERHFGPVARVFHELVSDLVHIDVLVVEPTEARPWYVLVTSGMSDLPMTVPAGASGPRHAELVLMVASPVSLTEAALRDESVYWPIRHLKQTARFPHELDTWLAPGQTLASDPPEPVAPGVPFCAFGVLELLEVAARSLRTRDGTEIAFLQLVPLHREELDWKLAQDGPGRLAGLFDTPALRVAMRDRPNLKGADQAAMVERFAAGAKAGQDLLYVIASLITLLAIADLAACYADGVRRSWSRFGIGLLLASCLAQGKAWARWAVVALQVIGVVAGVVVLLRSGLGTWRLIGLAAAIPLWAAMATTLLLAPSLRAFYAVARHRSET